MPGVIGVNAPDADILATLVSPLVQDTPPEVASEKNAVLPTQTIFVPKIGEGGVFTLIFRVMKQPVGSV